MHAHQITDPSDAKTFVTAGDAIFTIINSSTGAHLTYRVSKMDKRDGFFVKVLTGPSNENDYSYLGCIWTDNNKFVHGRKSLLEQDCPSVKGFRWFWKHLSQGRIKDPCEFWHKGRCGRCGRTLTVPSSIASGLGPVCAGKMRD